MHPEIPLPDGFMCSPYHCVHGTLRNVLNDRNCFKMQRLRLTTRIGKCDATRLCHDASAYLYSARKPAGVNGSYQRASFQVSLERDTLAANKLTISIYFLVTGSAARFPSHYWKSLRVSRKVTSSVFYLRHSHASCTLS